MDATSARAGLQPEVEGGAGLPPGPGFTAGLRSKPYLDGSADPPPGAGVYADSLADAGAAWSACVADAMESPAPSESWTAELGEAWRRLRGYSLARRAAWSADLLLRPIRGLLPCPAPFQRRLLRRSLEAAFQDAWTFAMIRDVGRPLGAAPGAALLPVRFTLPRLIAAGQFGPGKLTAEDHRRALRSREDFGGYVSRWLPPGAGPVAAAFRRPDAVRWLYDRVIEAISVVPEALLSKGVFGKICRSLFGVVAFKVAHLPPDLPQARVDQEIFESMQAGFHFGRTYLFDEIMDLDQVPAEDKDRFLRAVLGLLTGAPSADPPADPSARLVLDSLEAFPPLLGEARARSVRHAYLALAHSQIEDSRKSFEGAYSEREIYAPLMVKSAYTRILPAILGRLPITSEFLSHAYLAALPNQLVDDFRDLSEDLGAGTFTPYTYYVRAKARNPELRHPLAVHLHAISFVARRLGGHAEVRRLWITRLVSALRVFELKGGRGALRSFLAEHPCGGKDFERLLLDLGAFADLIQDPEALLASLASATSMYVRGMSAAPVAGH